MDYATLRKEGIRLLERMSGGEWTDFNAHDPGITLLEQLCYVLSDFAYRTGHAIPDLLAEQGQAPYASLHPPDAILSCEPVTQADLRRVVLDVEGVKNAWVEPMIDDAPAFYFNKSRAELLLKTSQLGAEPITPRGLHRVFIEPSGDVASPRLRALAAERLHACRSLGADLGEIIVLSTQPVQVEVTLEVNPIDNPQALLAQVRACLAEQIAPTVRFASLTEQLAAGQSFETIYEGPLLGRGFLPLSTTANENRRTTVYTSDLMHALMSLPAIRAVSRLRIAKGGTWEEWSLPIDTDKTPRLDAAGCKVTLRRGGQVILRSSLFSSGSESPPASPVPTRKDTTLQPPPARARQVGNYASLQSQLPMLYGIGEAGLPDSASDERKAQAEQLKAYLLFFDQLCANQFAQLSHLPDLLSFFSPAQTYFSQAVDEPALGLDTVRPLDAGHRQRLQALVEPPESEAALARKNRLLNHLLARFAEPISEYAQAVPLADLARQKQALLRDYPNLSRSRGTAHNILLLDAQHPGGLPARLKLDLGLSDAAGERVLIVEHIFLRPRREDFILDAQGQSLMSERPILASPLLPDPFSLQVSFVLPDGVGRFAQPDFKAFIEDQLRQRLPAHLIPYVHWLDAAAWATFTTAYAEFQQALRIYIARSYGIRLPDIDVTTVSLRAIDVRGARDRVIDLLQLGQTYPLPDTDVHAQSLTVGYGMSPTLYIDPAQKGVRYQLCEQTGQALSGFLVDGTGSQVTLVGPNIQADHSYRIRAYKIDHPERQTFLLGTVPIKIGLNTNLPVSIPALALTAPLIDYGSSVQVKVGSTQAGARYYLIDQHDVTVSVSSQMGNSGDILLSSQPLYEDVVLRVFAIRDTDLPEGQLPLSAILTASLAVAVRANPGVTVRLADSAIADYGGVVTLLIDSSQSSVVYTAHVYSALDTDFVRAPSSPGGLLSVEVPGGSPVYLTAPACPVPWQQPSRPCQVASAGGNGGTLSLPLPPLGEDSFVVIRAGKTHTAAKDLTSALQVTQSLALLCRPAPVANLHLQLTVGADGNSGSLLVTAGQPGVFYFFRTEESGTVLGLPAYFHKTDDSDSSGQLNRGLGQAWLTVDLVVARDPESTSSTDLSRRAPPDPVVELSALPTGDTLHVLAQKARTGVAWTTGRMVTVSRS